MAGKTLRC